MTKIQKPRAEHGADLRAAWARGGTLVLVLAVVVLSALLAYAFLFTTFRIQDDEGYFLLALRAQRGGASLYGEIDTIYGPFYFQTVGALFGLLHLPLDNVGARWFVFAVWMLACLGLFRYVQRVTGSVLAGLLAYFLSFPILSPLVSAPLHPGGLIVWLLSVLVLATLGLGESEKRSVSLAACGALAAAITLSKLNAGAFVLIAFVAFFVRFAPRTRTGLVLRTGLALALPLVPFLLMADKLGDGDFLAFASTVSLSLVPFAFLFAPESEGRSAPRIVPWILGGSVVTFLVLSICLISGSGWSGLWQSLVLGTLRFAGVQFVLPPEFKFGFEIALALAAIPIVLCARMRWMSWLRQEYRTLFVCAGGLTILILCCSSLTNCVRALPLVWLVAVPGTKSRREIELRTILALLVVLLALHAYPVAGNQAVPFAFLLPAVGVITISDSLHELPVEWRAVLRRPRLKWPSAVAAVMALAYFHPVRTLAPVLAKQLQRGVPLDLPGAETLRLPERRAAELVWVAKNLDHHGDTLVCMPGLHSFYCWTNLVPPVPFYPNTWILFYDEAKQAELARSLIASKRPCLVRSRAAFEFWTGKREFGDGPFTRATDGAMKLAGAVGEFELFIPRDARPDLLLSVLPDQSSETPRAPNDASRAYRLTFPVMEGVRVKRILVRDTQRGVDLLDSATADPAKHASIVNAAGKNLLGAGSSDFIDLSHRSDVILSCPPSSPELDAESTLVRAFDENGNVVARLLVPKGI